jgi:predicted Zn-dependent protease
MFEVLEKCLQTETASQAGLAQLRGQRRGITTCTVKNGVVEEFSSVSLGGVGIRVLVDDKSWGFSSSNTIDFESAEQTLKNALKLAKAGSNFKKPKNNT